MLLAAQLRRQRILSATGQQTRYAIPMRLIDWHNAMTRHGSLSKWEIRRRCFFVIIASSRMSRMQSSGSVIVPSKSGC